MLANAIAVTDDTFEQDIEQSTGLTLVDFSATWCHPCRLIDPILDEIALARRGEVTVATIDTDQNIGTTARYQVRSVPTILFFKDGQLVDRLVGIVPKARIEATILKHGWGDGAARPATSPDANPAQASNVGKSAAQATSGADGSYRVTGLAGEVKTDVYLWRKP